MLAKERELDDLCDKRLCAYNLYSTCILCIQTVESNIDERTMRRVAHSRFDRIYYFSLVQTHYNINYKTTEINKYDFCNI